MLAKVVAENKIMLNKYCGSNEFPLIKHFAQCEEQEIGYRDPHIEGEILFKSDFFTLPPLVRNLPPRACSRFYMNGGYQTLKRIQELDPMFFNHIFFLYDQSSLLLENEAQISITKVHLNVASEQPIMTQLTNAVQKALGRWSPSLRIWFFKSY